jgi:hypothetical protein
MREDSLRRCSSHPFVGVGQKRTPAQPETPPSAIPHFDSPFKVIVFD